MQDICGFKYIKKTQQIALYDRKKRGTQKIVLKFFMSTSLFFKYAQKVPYL